MIKPYRKIIFKGAKKTAAIINYNSLFASDLEKISKKYNILNPENAYHVDIYNADDVFSESEIGHYDVILHSGGDGRPVKDDLLKIQRLYMEMYILPHINFQ